VSEQHAIPEDRREAALVYYSLIRAYWRLADAARLGPVTDANRHEIEAETVELLEGAAGVVDELGPHPEELVESARDALRRIFFEAQSTCRLWNSDGHLGQGTGTMSAPPAEVKAIIAREKSKQSKDAPRGVCTLSFVGGDITGEGMTEEACTAVAQLTEATAVTWVEEQPIPGEEMDHGNGP
jgi:hypothetical protein